jgi:adenylate cyclase
VASNRRLAALMFTDIVGYTALTQSDEPSALKLLERHNQLLRPFFPRFHGREIKTEGDKFLVEFESALEATNCAVELQRLLYEHNLSAGPEAKIIIRIGIHLGDVVHTGDDILGDSVNIASRIEPLATPGGICITEPVFSQVRNKIPNELEKLAPQTLKNVRFPMEIYRVVLPWLVATTSPAGSHNPRLAILPFSNISPDPKDDYIADGLTEELITVISQLPEVRVIARTSVMQYRATTKAVSQIGTELGASTILEGSVRKAGSRLRITAQLVDASTQEHLWASSYDRDLDDVFAVQAEIAKQVAEALKIKLKVPEETRLEARPAVRSESYLAYLKGRTLLAHSAQSSHRNAKTQFELAIRLDPQNAAAYAGLASAIRKIGWFYEMGPREPWDAEGRRAASRALELDPNLSEAHSTQAMILWDDFDYPATERELKLAISLNPSNAEAHQIYGHILEELNRPEEALEQYRLAETADPLGEAPLNFHSRLLIWLGRYDEALGVIQKWGVVTGWSIGPHDTLVDYYRARGDLKRALEEIDIVIREQKGTDSPNDWKEFAVAWRYILTGDTEGARRIVSKLENSPGMPLTMAFCGWWYAAMGDVDACFRCWERAARERALPAQHLILDPEIEAIRKDPRFPALLKMIGLG